MKFKILFFLLFLVPLSDGGAASDESAMLKDIERRTKSFVEHYQKQLKEEERRQKARSEMSAKREREAAAEAARRKKFLAQRKPPKPLEETPAHREWLKKQEQIAKARAELEERYARKRDKWRDLIEKKRILTEAEEAGLIGYEPPIRDPEEDDVSLDAVESYAPDIGAEMPVEENFEEGSIDGSGTGEEILDPPPVPEDFIEDEAYEE